MKSFLKKMRKNESGQGIVEYVLLLLIVVGVLTLLRKPIQDAIMGKVGTLESDISNFGGN